MASRRGATGLVAILWAASAGGSIAACRPVAPVGTSWSIEQHATPDGADALVTVEIQPGSGGTPLAGATLSLEGHMAHPGMAPVVTPLTEMTPGHYQATLRLAMRGEWTLVLDGTLPDGSRVQAQHRIGVESAAAAP